MLNAAPLSFSFHGQKFSWSWEPALTVPLFTFGLLIAAGLVRLGSRLRYSAAWRRQTFLLWLGWFSLLVALNSPLHALGEELFWMHMTQHEILLLVSAPLFVIGNLLQVVTAGCPDKLRKTFAGGLRATRLPSLLVFLSRPLLAWCLGAAALWIWHVPPLFDSTLRNDWIHAAQHLTFISTSFLFWMALLESRARHTAFGLSILYLFATAIQTTFLGVLLTYSARPWYSHYVLTAPRLGYSALEDQQLGGLIMWIPAGFVFTAIAICLVPAWLRSSDARHSVWSNGLLNSGREGGSV